MIYKDITRELRQFLADYSYLHDSIVNEIRITNSDSVDENGKITVMSEGDKVEMLVAGQKGYKLIINLHNTTGLRLFRLSGFIIFEVAAKKTESELFFSLTGDYTENDIYFRCGAIEIKEIKSLDRKK